MRIWEYIWFEHKESGNHHHYHLNLFCQDGVGYGSWHHERFDNVFDPPDVSPLVVAVNLQAMEPMDKRGLSDPKNPIGVYEILLDM